MNRLLFFLVLFGITPLDAVIKPIKAVCIVPVADLLSQKFSSTKKVSANENYSQLPLSEKQPITLCCRATQLLFNEQVTIIQQDTDQSFIEVPFYHLKYPSFKSPSPKNNRFWTLTKNLCPLSQLTTQECAALPDPSNEPSTEKSIVLTVPWHCNETQKTYSAGTHFLTTDLNNTDYQVILYDAAASGPIKSTIPKNNCLEVKQRSNNQKRTIFVKIIQQWAHGIPDSIPYVHGGASIIATFTNPLFYEKKITLGKNRGIIFERPECTATPHTGVDCSGLIRLACNIAGIPMNATNSKSIAHSLRKLTSKDTISNGDILYWKGHIAIVTDVTKHLLVEARGYEHGYGFVQEIPYTSELQGINTTDKLMHAYLTKKPIQRLNKKGEPREIITDIALYSIT